MLCVHARPPFVVPGADGARAHVDAVGGCKPVGHLCECRTRLPRYRGHLSRPPIPPRGPGGAAADPSMLGRVSYGGGGGRARRSPPPPLEHGFREPVSQLLRKRAPVSGLPGGKVPKTGGQIGRAHVRVADQRPNPSDAGGPEGRSLLHAALRRMATTFPPPMRCASTSSAHAPIITRRSSR